MNFRKDMLVKAGGETEIRPWHGDKVIGEDGTPQVWQSIAADENTGNVNLGEHFTKRKYPSPVASVSYAIGDVPLPRGLVTYSLGNSFTDTFANYLEAAARHQAVLAMGTVAGADGNSTSMRRTLRRLPQQAAQHVGRGIQPPGFHRVVGGPLAIGVGEGRDVRRLAGGTFDQVFLQFEKHDIAGRARTIY